MCTILIIVWCGNGNMVICICTLDYESINHVRTTGPVQTDSRRFVSDNIVSPFVRFCLWLLSCYNSKVSVVDTTWSTKPKLLTISPLEDNSLSPVLNSILFYCLFERKISLKSFQSLSPWNLLRIFPKQNYPQSGT